jgi:hypothetical protein
MPYQERRHPLETPILDHPVARLWQARSMCRNIKVLHNFEPPATDSEVRAAALQYVRKVSGAARPSAANQAVFDDAVAQIAHVTQHLLEALVTSAPPRDREVEAVRARQRSEKRFGPRAASV